MIVDLDQNCDKDEFNNIKTAIGYTPKLALYKLSYVNFCKLPQITKKNDNFRHVVPHFDIKFK